MQWNLPRHAGAGGRLLRGARARRLGLFRALVRAAQLARRPSRPAITEGPVAAAAERGTVWATQFHPEKSSMVGLGIFANFVRASIRSHGALPGDRPERRGGACAWPKAISAARPFTAPTPWSVRRPSRPAAPAGSTWSTWTRQGREWHQPAGGGAIAAAVSDPGAGRRGSAQPGRCGRAPRRRDCQGRGRHGSCAAGGFLAEIAQQWPGRVAAGVDHRNGEVRVKGWAEGAGRDVASVVESSQLPGPPPSS